MGISSGVHIVKEELIELCKIVAEYGGVYATHMSDEGEGIFQALRDEIEIGEKSGVSVEISHLKLSRKPVWGKTREVLTIIEKAKARGVDVTCDQYPYVAWYTGLTHITRDQHPYFSLLIGERMLKALQNKGMRDEIKWKIRKALDNVGGPEKILIAAPISPLNEKYQGKTIKDIADEEGIDPVEAIIHVLSQGQACTVCSSIQEKDVRDFMRHWAVMVATDGHVEIYGIGATHPRNYGTYPRVLGKYVRKEKLLTLEDAVRKMTSFPAQKFGLRNRGLLREGMAADITIFDPEKVEDRSTFRNPHQYPQGIEYVIINGQLVVDQGKHTGALAGKVLRSSGAPVRKKLK
jgi:N-acyl-D-aspartate/D-glutamate deacylase